MAYRFRFLHPRRLRRLGKNPVRANPHLPKSGFSSPLDNYYNGIFSDDTVWQAYALVSPDTDEILYAYAKRDTPQFLAMEKILESDEHLHRATLEITSLPDAGERQFQISRVLAENWVMGEKAFDESF